MQNCVGFFLDKKIVLRHDNNSTFPYLGENKFISDLGGKCPSKICTMCLQSIPINREYFLKSLYTFSKTQLYILVKSYETVNRDTEPISTEREHLL